MEYEILVDGVKLSAKIKDVKVTDRQGARSDDIRLVVLNDDTLNVKEGQSLECNFGGFKSGDMNIDKVASGTISTEIGAISAPVCSKERRTRHWRKVRFFGIVNNVAVNCGLSVFYNGVTNHYYENVTQFEETDLAFLQRLCTREGYCLKIDNNRLVLYSKEFVEKAESVKTITLSDVIDNKIAFAENPNKVRSVTVKYYSNRLIEYTAASGEYGEAITIREYVSNDAEAERFAKGYLAEMKQNDTTVDVLVNLDDGVAAGNCVNFSGFARFDGKYVISEICYDPENNQARLRGRKVQ